MLDVIISRVHLFHAPALLHEFRGQPIQEFRVGRRGAGLPEIADRPHDAVAEVLFPDSVHHHARGQRVFRIREPFGEGQAAPCLVAAGPGGSDLIGELGRHEHRGRSRLNFRTKAGGHAALQNVAGRRRSAIPQSTNLRLRQHLVLQQFDLGLKLFGFLGEFRFRFQLGAIDFNDRGELVGEILLHLVTLLGGRGNQLA